MTFILINHQIIPASAIHSVRNKAKDLVIPLKDGTDITVKKSNFSMAELGISQGLQIHSQSIFNKFFA